MNQTRAADTPAFAHVTAAIAKPFRPADLSVDLELLERHARWLLSNGCDGLVLFGTTGEAASLSLAERKTILEHVLTSVIDPRQVLVGTSACAMTEVVELTRRCAELGCAGALIMPPFFFKGITVDGALSFYAEVFARCGTELPPIYLYHIPQTSGVAVGSELVGRLIERFGTKIRGYKDSSGDWANTAEIRARFPQLETFVGSEALLLANLNAGGAGCISASVNVQPRATRELYDRWRSGHADSLQESVSQLRKALERAGPLIASTKAAVAALHREHTWAHPRPPLLALSPSEQRALQSRLRELKLAGLD
jgi:4-hydroxy-tetrahydrodipicolinate synthase